jgi:excisionase family DNA binding protein
MVHTNTVQSSVSSDDGAKAIEKVAVAATLTVDEAHELIGRGKISRASLYNAIKRAEVPHLQLGRRILIPRHALMRWLQSGGDVL